MNQRTIITLVLALAFGVAAVFLAQMYLRREAPNGPGGQVAQTTQVVVAARPIEFGAKLDASMLKTVAFPADSVPAGAFTSADQLVGGENARVAMRAFALNEPILATRVSERGGRLSLSGLLREGMRAVTLRSNEVASVGGFVLPGDRVDILLTREIDTGPSAQNSPSVTQIIGENIRVLGVDQNPNEETDRPAVPRAITIEVTPEQAQAISLAQQVGTVTLSLRHMMDELPNARMATTSNDFGFVRMAARSYASAPAAPRAPRPQPAVQTTADTGGGWQVRVVRGTETSDYSVAVR